MAATSILHFLERTRFARSSPRAGLAAFDPADFNPPLKTALLILQPTPFCNMNCSYCYLPDRDNRARMQLTTVRLAAKRLVDDDLLDDRLAIVWHAGEPLVLPTGYYEEAFAAITQTIGSQCAVEHSIQTNATLIDDAWCEFFLRHGVKVGVSIDGPAELHDRHRRARSGKGTHTAVMRGITALREHGVPHHAIAVITAETVGRADQIHQFFRELGISQVGFNFDEVEGPHAESSLEGKEDAHQAFIDRMLSHMLASCGQFEVRELAYALHLIGYGHSEYRCRGQSFPENAQTVPFKLITVGWNGGFSTFSPELLGQQNRYYEDFVLGNVHTSGYLAAASSPLFTRLWRDVQSSVAACRASCPYFDYCGGGSPANKLYENDSMVTAETLYCRSMIQRPFEAVLRALEGRHPSVLPRDDAHAVRCDEH
jgi:uncharacterized protein